MRVAVVGTGVSGLSAVWILKKYSDHEVNVYERNAVAGPAQLEVAVDGKEGVRLDAYPLTVAASDAAARAFLADASVPLRPAASGLSASRDGHPLWSAGDWRSLSLADALSPRAWRLALDVARWESSGATGSGTLAAFLENEGYSRALFDDYLLPRIAASFLTPSAEAAFALPASAVLARLSAARSARLALSGADLASSVGATLPSYNLHTATNIAAISSHDAGVTLTEAGGQQHVYDHVVLALPGATALQLLQAGGWASEEERVALAGRGQADAVVRFRPGSGTSVDCWTTPPAYGGTETGVAASPSFALGRGVALTVYPHDGDVGALVRESVPLPPVDAGAAAALAAVQNTRRISFVGAHAHDVGSALASATEVLSRLNATPPYPAQAALSPPSALTLRALRLAVVLADTARRATAPLFFVIGWPVAFALAVVGRVAGLLGLRDINAAATKLGTEWA
ncbi:uncharacterized protein LOC62_03G004197 [Vanrija pseudolonga]|uniref:Amine oxidase domain-containing protein n=1 Tax=Vanrija pseudolonga TaxID=143232 RepID=A0AAF0Y5H6_9TREE|nr:hypothetical protein LOC62_03G004197 [Vanrija pseudolonga]